MWILQTCMTNEDFITVAKCQSCAAQGSRNGHHKQIGLLPAAGSLKIVAMDIPGPLPKTKQEISMYRSLMTAIRISHCHKVYNEHRRASRPYFVNNLVIPSRIQTHLLDWPRTAVVLKFFSAGPLRLGIKHLKRNGYYSQTKGQEQWFNLIIVACLKIIRPKIRQTGTRKCTHWRTRTILKCTSEQVDGYNSAQFSPVSSDPGHYNSESGHHELWWHEIASATVAVFAIDFSGKWTSLASKWTPNSEFRRNTTNVDFRDLSNELWSLVTEKACWLTGSRRKWPTSHEWRRCDCLSFSQNRRPLQSSIFNGRYHHYGWKWHLLCSPTRQGNARPVKNAKRSRNQPNKLLISHWSGMNWQNTRW